MGGRASRHADRQSLRESGMYGRIDRQEGGRRWGERCNTKGQGEVVCVCGGGRGE